MLNLLLLRTSASANRRASGLHPQNGHMIIADQNYVKASERIKELGRFSHDGKFIPNEKEKELLKELGFSKS